MQTNEKIEHSSVVTPGIEHYGDRVRFIVENIKCDGCANTITRELHDLHFKDVVVDPQSSSVEIDKPEDPTQINLAVVKLRQLGYPLIDSEEGLKAAALKAKSFLSCAIGRMNPESK